MVMNQQLDPHALLDAAADGDIAGVRRLLKAGVDVNARDGEDDTALHMAATSEIVYALVDAGANLAAKNDKEETPLHQAAADGDGPIVAALLIVGADPALTDWLDCTPLHHAESPEVVRHLVAAGAPVDRKNQAGETPIFWAVWNGRKAVVEALCHAGADIYACNHEGLSPMGATIKACHPKISKILHAFGAPAEQG